MKILYKGTFLREGLRALGHDIVALKGRAEICLPETVAALDSPPDLILLELFGKSEFPHGLRDCPVPLAAYVIDAPLNEFWLAHLLKLFDHVFVDQPSSVGTLARHGVNAHWAPLFALQSDFRPPMEKRHFVSFVGRTSQHRAKRSNILRIIRQRFEIEHVKGVSRDTMQDISAQSHVVLNESFFPGVNLRTFQAMASGSLLLTEDSEAMRQLFTPGEHYQAYTPGTVLQVLERINKDPDALAGTALAARKLCAERHTSEARAREILETIKTPETGNQEFSREEKRFAEAVGTYMHRLRYGGDFKHAFDLLRSISQDGGELAAQARLHMGNILARGGRFAPAAEHLAAATQGSGHTAVLALMKLTLLHVIRQEPQAMHQSLKQLDILLARTCPEFTLRPELEQAKQESMVLRHALFVYFAHLLAHMGEYCHVGFLKRDADQFPDTALEFAILAWNQVPSAQALEIIVLGARQSGIAPEALPYLKQAIAKGLASNRLIALTMELASEYGDFELARSISKGLRWRLHEGKN